MRSEPVVVAGRECNGSARYRKQAVEELLAEVSAVVSALTVAEAHVDDTGLAEQGGLDGDGVEASHDTSTVGISGGVGNVEPRSDEDDVCVRGGSPECCSHLAETVPGRDPCHVSAMVVRRAPVSDRRVGGTGC